MKKCDYCGRVNADEAGNCVECGTALIESTGKKPIGEPQDPIWLEWLGTSLRYAGTLILAAFLYFLSYGPVDRYCNKVVTRVSTPTMHTVTVRYPRWVSILYRPAFYLRFRSELYRRYISWWNRDGPDR